MIGALIGWMVLGMVAGAVGRLLVPGRQPMGLLMTMLLGIAGSYVGGFFAFLLTGGSWLQPSGWILSSLGAAAALAGYLAWAKKQSRT